MRTIVAIMFYYYTFDVAAETENRLEIQLQLLQDIAGNGFNTDVLPGIEEMLIDFNKRS